MDPLSQGVLGAALPQSFTKNKQDLFYAGFIGFLSGMAADLDVLIRSNKDPLLFLEYHRQFTHSLLFIPFGGLICALVFFFLFKKKMSFRHTYFYCTLGYATHGLLDACTSYGTLLFWPFSHYRVAWNNVSIVDPLFTLPLLILIIIGTIKKNHNFHRFALVYGISYLLLGVFQNHRAIEEGKILALSRGHQVLEISARPSFANLILWKIIYSTEDRFYVDAIRMGFFSSPPKIFPGDSIKKIDVEKDFPDIDKNSQTFKDIQRFKWFSKGYIAINPTHSNQIMDMRYSMIPNEISPLWGIQIDPNNQPEHVKYLTTRQVNEQTRNKLWQMLFN